MYLDQHFLGGQGEPRREDLRPEGQGQRGRDEGIRGRNASCRYRWDQGAG